MFLSVDPMFESTGTPYQYSYQNPVKYADPTGMKGEWTEVTKNDDGSYTVVAGVADKDRNIYVMKDGKRTDEVVGQSLTPYSFFDDQGRPVIRAVIHPGDMSGSDFLINEIINNQEMTLLHYMKNATERKSLDFKNRGIKNKPKGMTGDQYRYRGMLFSIDEMKASKDNLATFGSARDFGNVAAGYIAGFNGLTWAQARFGFDGLQTYQDHGLSFWNWSKEGLPTRTAQAAGYKGGHAAFLRMEKMKMDYILKSNKRDYGD